MPNVVKSSLANAVTSSAADHIVAVTHDLYDETQSKYQDAINGQVVLNTMIFLTEEEYEELDPKDPTRLYAIYED